jgi:predicted permease
MNTTTNTTTTTNINDFYVQLIYQSACSMMEIVVETLIGILIVQLNIISFQDSKTFVKFLSVLLSKFFYPFLFIDKLSK